MAESQNSDDFARQATEGRTGLAAEFVDFLTDPISAAISSMNARTSSGMSSRRSLSGGSLMLTTLSR